MGLTRCAFFASPDREATSHVAALLPLPLTRTLECLLTMAELTLENHEIEKRLGFTKEMDKRQAKETPPETLAPPARNKSGIRRTIARTRSSAKLMRQVSALGMEDPVFRTTENGPEHPSNIFDDMGVNDIPEDMLDMVSIASDPTAAEGDGLDTTMFHMSLNTFESGVDMQHNKGKRRPSLLDGYLTTLMNEQRSLIEDDVPNSPPEDPPRMEESSVSESQVNSATSSLKTNQSPVGKKSVVNKIARRHSVNSRKLNPPTSRATDQKLNNSLPSLDLDAVFGPTRALGTRERKPRRAKRRSAPQTDSLLAEAAKALEGSINQDLIETAKVQHRECSPCETIQENTVELSGCDDLPRRRILPTISGIFPQEMMMRGMKSER